MAGGGTSGRDVGTRLRRNRLFLTSTRPLVVLMKYRLCFPTSTTTLYRSYSLVSWLWIATWLPMVISGRECAC